LICYDSNKFLIHDVEKKSLTKFSKDNLKSFPVNYLNQYNRIYGCFELTPTKIVLYTHFTYIVVDLTMKFEEFCQIVKDRRTDTRVMNYNEAMNFHQKKYMSMLPNHGGMIGEGLEMSKGENR
jgi:hypothetical protein